MGSPVSGVSSMRKSVFVLAVIGAACSSVAFAAEVKKDKAHVPAVKATIMSDAQMDKVTAGDAGGQGKGQGNAFGYGQIGTPAAGLNPRSEAGRDPK
jgi:hypothetical protein